MVWGTGEESVVPPSGGSVEVGLETNAQEETNEQKLINALSSEVPNLPPELIAAIKELPPAQLNNLLNDRGSVGKINDQLNIIASLSSDELKGYDISALGPNYSSILEAARNAELNKREASEMIANIIGIGAGSTVFNGIEGKNTQNTFFDQILDGANIFKFNDNYSINPTEVSPIALGNMTAPSTPAAAHLLAQQQRLEQSGGRGLGA